MNPWVFAFVTISPLAFLLGFAASRFLASEASSPSVVTLTDAQLKELAMAVFAELVQPLADLDTAVAALPAKVAAAVAKGDPAAAQDKADTLSAVETTLSAATQAINGVGQ